MTRNQRTTGQTISRLGVLTVLAFNELAENQLDEEERNARIAEINEILDGQAGVGAQKVYQRSVERGVMGAFN